MEEFTPIETQEAFDAAIKDRLARQENKIRGEYADYDELKKKSTSWKEEKGKYEESIAAGKKSIEELNQKLSEANGKIAQYELDALKIKVATEAGIPARLCSYLKGTSEDELKKSAEELGKFTKGGQVAPLADPEGDEKNDYSFTGKVNESRAMKKFAESLKAINEN